MLIKMMTMGCMVFAANLQAAVPQTILGCVQRDANVGRQRIQLNTMPDGSLFYSVDSCKHTVFSGCEDDDYFESRGPIAVKIDADGKPRTGFFGNGIVEIFPAKTVGYIFTEIKSGKQIFFNRKDCYANIEL